MKTYITSTMVIFIYNPFTDQATCLTAWGEICQHVETKEQFANFCKAVIMEDINIPGLKRGD